MATSSRTESTAIPRGLRRQIMPCRNRTGQAALEASRRAQAAELKPQSSSRRAQADRRILQGHAGRNRTDRMATSSRTESTAIPRGLRRQIMPCRNRTGQAAELKPQSSSRPEDPRGPRRQEPHRSSRTGGKPQSSSRPEDPPAAPHGHVKPQSSSRPEDPPGPRRQEPHSVKQA